MGHEEYGMLILDSNNVSIIYNDINNINKKKLNIDQ
ncbi:hypothetical protein LCGC14_0868650 [marine sediment metagenome]|uniref:Uncharacterized protein n=1 Tax=marine sediment metagenome TaxID=412755 RepID=A0A0F9P5C0_9ZZZZ